MSPHSDALTRPFFFLLILLFMVLLFFSAAACSSRSSSRNKSCAVSCACRVVSDQVGGRVDVVGAGGLPIGLIEGAKYESVKLGLHPGDRMLMCSDG